MSSDQILAVQEMIDGAMATLKTASAMLQELTGVTDSSRERHTLRASSMGSTAGASGRIVEGSFDGQNMVDAKGQTYPIPANYASKSKLVEGDGMKLTITDDGKFVYKQIAPTPRRTVVGVLIQEDGQYKVLAEGKVYRILLASVTFYRAEVGDQVTIILPADGPANWGAVEGIIPRHIAEAAAPAILAGDESSSTSKTTRRKRTTAHDDGELTPSIDEE